MKLIKNAFYVIAIFLAVASCKENKEESQQEIQQKAKLAIAKVVAEISDFRVKEWNKENLEDNVIRYRKTKTFSGLD